MQLDRNKKDKLLINANGYKKLEYNCYVKKLNVIN